MADDENRHLAAPEEYDALEPDEDSFDEDSEEETSADAEMTGDPPSTDFDPALPTQHSVCQTSFFQAKFLFFCIIQPLMACK